MNGRREAREQPSPVMSHHEREREQNGESHHNEHERALAHVGSLLEAANGARRDSSRARASCRGPREPSVSMAAAYDDRREPVLNGAFSWRSAPVAV
jgi:hypothetical protein